MGHLRRRRRHRITLLAEPVSRMLLIVGALVGGVGASKTARILVRESPGIGWGLVRRAWQAARRWVRRRLNQVRLSWRQLRKWAKQKLLRRRRDHRDDVTARFSLSANGTDWVTPGPVEKRVEQLEEWRTNTEADQGVGAKLLVWGFLMIAAGSILDWVAC